jgi:DNA topoisomerase-3
VIGAEPVARTQVIKKLWDYIKANGCRTRQTSAPSTPTPSCMPVFGKPQVTMFELAASSASTSPLKRQA